MVTMDAAMTDMTETMMIAAVTGQNHQRMTAAVVPQDVLPKTTDCLTCQGAGKPEEFLPISKGIPVAVRYRNNRIVLSFEEPAGFSRLFLTNTYEFDTLFLMT